MPGCCFIKMPKSTRARDAGRKYPSGSTKRKISKAIKSAKEKQKGALNKYFKRTKSESSGESGQENDSNMLQDRQQSTALQYYPLRVMRQNTSTSKIF